MRLDVDEDVEVFSKAPSVGDVDPENPGKFTPLPPPQLPLAPTLVGDITAAPSEIRSSTPMNEKRVKFVVYHRF